jgi:hypothetical protein
LALFIRRHLSNLYPPMVEWWRVLCWEYGGVRAMSKECRHIATNLMWLVTRDDYSLQSADCADCNQSIVRETAPVSAKYNWEDWRITK